MSTTPTERERLAMRANGTAFAILYEPKRYPPAPRPPTKEEIAKQRNLEAAKARYYAKKGETAPVPLHSLSAKAKTQPKTRAKVLKDNTRSTFCTQISAKADAAKTARIRGRAC